MVVYYLNAIVFSTLFTSSLATRLTIDDADSRWTYTGQWAAITPNNPCPAPRCPEQLDSTKTFNNTWHDSLGQASTAHLAFSGTAIEIYVICPTYTPNNNYGTNFTFTLDSVADGTFRGPEPACTKLIYNYLVYARRNLSNGDHSFIISNSPMVGLTYSTSVLLLDYGIYDDGKDNDAASTGHKSLPVAAAAAPAAILGVLLLAAIAFAFWLNRRKTKSLTHADESIRDPSDVQYNPLSSPPPARSSFLQSQADATVPPVPSLHSNVAQPAPEPAWRPSTLPLATEIISTPSHASVPPGAQSPRVFSPPPGYSAFVGQSDIPSAPIPQNEGLSSGLPQSRK